MRRGAGTNVLKGENSQLFNKGKKREQMDSPDKKSRWVVGCKGRIWDAGIRRVHKAHSTVKKKKSEENMTYHCLNGKRGPM